MLDQSEIKAQFPGVVGKVYANTSSCGLVSDSGVRLMGGFMRALRDGGSLGSEQFLENDLPGIRTTVGEFINADPSEIALVPNFSFALNAVLPALGAYSKVLLLRDDYPSLTQPFLLNDFEINWISARNEFSFDLNEIESVISAKKVEIVAVSQVQYLSGFCLDIEALGEICQKYGAILIVDGTQSLGAYPYSFRNSLADVFISSNYKWMNAGFGTGILAMKQSFLQNHGPRIGGYSSFAKIQDNWVYESSIHSFEPGHLNFGGLMVLEDAIRLKMSLGLEAIFRHNQKLLDRLTEGLHASGMQLVGPVNNRDRCGMVCFKDSPQVTKALLDEGIIFKSRNGNIRLGMHFYNDEQDVDRILRATGSLI